MAKRNTAANVDSIESNPVPVPMFQHPQDAVVQALAALEDSDRVAVLATMLESMAPDAVRAILPESVVSAIQSAAKARKRDQWQSDLESAVASFTDGDGKTFAAWKATLPAHLFLCGPSGRPRDADPGSRLYLISKHAPDDFSPVMVCDVLADTTRRNGKLFKRVSA